MKKNDVKLYNVIFPIWLLWLFPVTWIVVLPGNFIVDLLVVVLTMKWLKIKDIKGKTKSVILKVWVFGFLADFIGTAALLFSMVAGESADRLAAVAYNPFDNFFAFFWTAACVILTAVCIYFFNYRYCLKKAELSDAEKKRLALSLAVFTAPYLFFMPTSLIY